jgi:hypothetical protein
MNIANCTGYAQPWHLLVMAPDVTGGVSLEFAADAISEMPSSDMYNLASVHYNFVNYDSRTPTLTRCIRPLFAPRSLLVGDCFVKKQKLSVRDLTDFV